jgi:hypothetical protein
MNYINQIAYHLQRRDEVPNQELARKLAEEENIEGIKEIASYLKDKNKSIASDCLKVMYEIGYINPNLLIPYAEELIGFLKSKNNRMVWGGMIAIANLAKVIPERIIQELDSILEIIETGSVITNVWGVYTVINLADNGYYDKLKDTLFKLQEQCRNVDYPKRAESMADVIAVNDKAEFIQLLENRLVHLTKAGALRTQKVIKKMSLML